MMTEELQDFSGDTALMRAVCGGHDGDVDELSHS
jgi:hypothetical protein